MVWVWLYIRRLRNKNSASEPVSNCLQILSATHTGQLAFYFRSECRPFLFCCCAVSLFVSSSHALQPRNRRDFEVKMAGTVRCCRASLKPPAKILKMASEEYFFDFKEQIVWTKEIYFARLLVKQGQCFLCASNSNNRAFYSTFCFSKILI